MFKAIGISFLLLGLISCFNPSSKILINGGGASFPYLLYSKWFSEYRSVEPEIFINYQSIGSGGGIRQFLKGTLDFGATDIPVADKKNLKKLIHIPTALGAVSVVYNVPNFKKTLRFDGKTLAKIFLGEIKNWKDPQIRNLNPDFPEIDLAIVPVYRSDSSGTTYFFTEFLSKTYPAFLKKLGFGKSISWPEGVGGKGNEGTQGLVNKIPGTIGYVSSSYAKSQKIPSAKIKNKFGNFVLPTPENIKQAGLYALKNNKNYLKSLILTEGKITYPLSGLTYIVISSVKKDQKTDMIIKFLNWALTKGQKFSTSLNFTPLPKSISEAAIRRLANIQRK